MTDSLLDEAINLATSRTGDHVAREDVALAATALLTVLFDNDIIRQLGMTRPCPGEAHQSFGVEADEDACRGCRGRKVVPVTGDFLRAALRLDYAPALITHDDIAHATSLLMDLPTAGPEVVRERDEEYDVAKLVLESLVDGHKRQSVESLDV